MGIDLSGWNQFAQNLKDLRLQNSPLPMPDNAAQLSTPQVDTSQQNGFLSNILSFAKDPANPNQQQAQGMLGRLFGQNQQQPQPNPAVAPQVAQAAVPHGLPPPDQSTVGPASYYARAQSIETPNGESNTFQFQPSTWKQYGQGDINNPVDNFSAMQRLTQSNNAQLASALGRPPTAGELYLAHQQGAGGAISLLTNPDKTPAQLGLGPAVAGQAQIVRGDPSAPSSQFVSKINSQFADVPSPFGVPQAATGQKQAQPSFFNWAKNNADFGPGENLVTVPTAVGHNITANAQAAPHFQNFLSDLQKSGYDVKTLYSYAPRDIAGTNTLSEHAYGNAIDINPGQNPVTHGQLQTDLPANIRDLAAKNSLVWGGDMHGSKKDTMHFEYNPNVAGGAQQQLAMSGGPGSSNAGRVPNAPGTLQPSAWAGTPLKPPGQVGQSAAPTAPAAPGGAITVPGYEEAGPLTIDKATDAEGFPSKQEWLAAYAKGAPPVNMGAAAPAQQVAQAPAGAVPAQAPIQTGPAPQNAVPGAAAPYVQNAGGQASPGVNALPPPPAGPVVPHYSDQQLQSMAANPYQHWKLQDIMEKQKAAAQLQNQMAMAYYQKQLEEGTAKIQEFPVNDANGNMVGKQHAFVGLGTNGQPQIVPFGGVDTNVIKATASKLPTSVQEWQFAKDHPDYARAPKWVPNASTDALGQPVGGWVSPPNQAQAAQAGAPGQAALQGSTGQNIAMVGGQPVDMTKTGDDFLSQLPLTYQQAVKNYVGGQTMPTGRGGFVQEIKLLAQKYGNDIGMPADDTMFNARKAMRNSLSVTTPNSLGGQMQFLNTGIGHLATMSDNAIALNNSDGWGSTTLARAINNIRGLTTDQAAAVGKIQDSAVRYGQELTKFYAGSPGGEQERQAFLANVQGAKSPKELASVIENEAELIPARGLGLQREIDVGLGPLSKQYQVFQPESKAALEKISNNIDTLRGQNRGTLFPSIAAVPGPNQGTPGVTQRPQTPQTQNQSQPQQQQGNQLPNGASLPPGKTLAGVVQDVRNALKAGAITPDIAARALQRFGLDPSRVAPAQ